jgi:F-type H+-transporting ATPase subunit delta
MSIENLVAKKYAEALFLVGKDLNKIDSVYKELNDFFGILQNNEKIQRLILNRLVPKTVKSICCNTLLQQKNVSGTMKRFIHILIEKKRLNLLEGIILYFKALLNRYRKIRIVKVTLARKVSDVVIKKIKNQVMTYFKDQKLEFDFKIDKKILGGLVVKIDSLVIDFSILSKLYKMRPKINVSNLKEMRGV